MHGENSQGSFMLKIKCFTTCDVLLVSKDTLQVSVEYIQTSENSNGFAYPLYDKKKIEKRS